MAPGTTITGGSVALQTAGTRAPVTYAYTLPVAAPAREDAPDICTE